MVRNGFVVQWLSRLLYTQKVASSILAETILFFKNNTLCFFCSMFNREDRNSHFLTQKLAKSALEVRPILLHSLSTVETPVTATSLQWPLSSVPKVAVVKRFICTLFTSCKLCINQFVKLIKQKEPIAPKAGTVNRGYF